MSTWIARLRLGTNALKTTTPKVDLEAVYRYAFARLQSVEDAEDVTMEVAERLVHPVQGEINRLYAWRIARDRVTDRLRQKRRSPSGETQDEPSTTPVISSVHYVLNQMDEDQAELLVLKYLHGLTSQEIAELTDRTPTAVNSALQRARAEFRILGKATFPHLDQTQGETP